MPNLNHLNQGLPPQMAHLGTRYATLPTWGAITGMSRSGTYVELGRGNLKAIKHGRRILIDVEAGLAWLRSLPAATIRAPKNHSAQ